MTSDAVQFRRDFWTRYAELYPNDGVPAGWGRSHARVTVESAGVHVSLAVVNWGVGVSLRGRQGELPEDEATRLEPFRDSFRKTVGDAFNGRPSLVPATEWTRAAGGFDASREFDAGDPENWQHMAAWLHYMLHIYLWVIEKALAVRG